MHDKKKKRGKWPPYKIAEELMAAPNFREEVEEYHAYLFL